MKKKKFHGRVSLSSGSYSRCITVWVSASSFEEAARRAIAVSRTALRNHINTMLARKTARVRLVKVDLHLELSHSIEDGGPALPDRAWLSLGTTTQS